MMEPLYNYLIPTPDIPFLRDFGAIAPRLTGSLSAISSALIVYAILRSSTGLSSTYHRLMFGMSVFDMFGSIAMALTTLPMPREDEVIKYYNVVGTRLGTTQTCTIQGFMFWFCAQGTFLYNVTLCIYYVAAIFWRLDGLTIRKYLEPFLHLIPIGIGLGIAILPLIYDLYNPSPWAPWCSVGESLHITF